VRNLLSYKKKESDYALSFKRKCATITVQGENSRTCLSIPSLEETTVISPSSFITAKACLKVNVDPTRYAILALFIALADFIGTSFM
jgi:hypothetical protein